MLDTDDLDNEWSERYHGDSLEEFTKLRRELLLEHDSPYENNILALWVEERKAFDSIIVLTDGDLEEMEAG